MFGANVLAPYVDRALVEQHIARLKPALLLIMGDNPSDPSAHYWARDLKQKYPACTVAYRQYNAADQNWDGYSAEQLWAIHSPYAVDGLVVQVWNEPNGYQPLDSLISRAVKLCQYARLDGKRVGLPAWGVGHPDDARVDAGELDPLLRELAADPRADGNLYIVHEYAQASTQDEQPYRIGRFQRTVARSQAIGAPLPYRRIAVTEYGRDYAGNPATDGWRVYFNNDEGAFYNFMLPGMDLYRRLGVLGADVFCCGTTWASFDYQHAETLKSDMEGWNMANVTPVPPQPTYPPGTKPRQSKVNQPAGLKLRVNPTTSASTIRIMPYGEVVTEYLDPTAPDAVYHGWHRVTDAIGYNGWSALYIDGNPSLIPVAPTPEPPAFKLYAPFHNYVITSRFNDPRDYSFAPDKLQRHEGIDGIDGIARQYGSDPVIHVGRAGTVVKVGYDARGYGNFCIVDFGDNWRGWYAHAAELYVREGQKVTERQIIALMGSTGGTSTAPHCHITLQHIPQGLDNYVVADVVDPEPYLVTW